VISQVPFFTPFSTTRESQHCQFFSLRHIPSLHLKMNFILSSQYPCREPNTWRPEISPLAKSSFFLKRLYLAHLSVDFLRCIRLLPCVTRSLLPTNAYGTLPPLVFRLGGSFVTDQPLLSLSQTLPPQLTFFSKDDPPLALPPCNSTWLPFEKIPFSSIKDPSHLPPKDVPPPTPRSLRYYFVPISFY